MIFTATVISMDLPNKAKVVYETPKLTVSVMHKFLVLFPEKTRFVSEELFTYKELFNRAFGFLTKKAIKKAHYKSMNDFVKIAESIR